MTPVIAIVVPCYNEESVLQRTHEQLSQLLSSLVQQGKIDELSRLTYVDDGSTDGTWASLTTICAQSTCACAIKLASNSGQQNAIVAGLSAMVNKVDVMVTIDADLQDDIAAIPEMLNKWAEGCDVVYGVRNKRKADSWFKRNSAQWFYRTMSHMGIKMVYNHADFRLMSHRAVMQLLQYSERNLFLRGIVPTIGYKSATVSYDRKERPGGSSKYTFGKMMGFAIDGITSFSIRPVRLVLTMGVTFVCIAIVILAYVLYSKFSGHAVSGWSSMILSVWFIGGCILIGLGIVGEYIGKIYIEVKGRPRYNVEKEIIK